MTLRPAHSDYQLSSAVGLVLKLGPDSTASVADGDQSESTPPVPHMLQHTLREPGRAGHADRATAGHGGA